MKRFIQLFSLLGLALIFSAATAKAQTVTKVDAKIPFKFSVGGKTHDAGSYKLKVQSIATGGALVTIVDSDGHNLQSVLAVTTGEVAKGQSELRFAKHNGQRNLVGIALPTTGLQIGTSKSEEATTITRRSVKPAESAARKS
jgi:hypothetical protein